MNAKHRIKLKAVSLSRRIAYRANYLLNNYREVIWLVGDGRSGTTWVSNLINHDKQYREMFEPFHPRLVIDADFIEANQYIRKSHMDEKLMTFASNIFSGKFTHARVDRCNCSYRYNGILVKDIFANLLCYAISHNFPKVRPVLLIRNPFSVAISKYKKKEWFWVTEPLDLLAQKDLYEDYLHQFEDIIRKTSAKKNYILNQILIWSIINYIPLRQFNPGRIHICFYEKIYTEPDREISSLLRFVRNKGDDYQVNINKEIVNKPSRVSGAESNLRLGTCPISSWQSALNPRLIDDGHKLLEHFGFDVLYDDMSMPRMNVLKKIHHTA
jgi:hypothetical protein